VGKFLVHSRVSESALDPRDRAKPAVILVHGLGVSGRYLKPTGKVLAQNYRVYIPDLPGNGKSQKVWPPLNLDELAATIAGWMDTQGIQQAHFYANSLGCQTMAHFAVHYPGRVQSLVMGGPTVDCRGRDWLSQVFRLALDFFREPPGLMWVIFRDYLVCGPPRVIVTGVYALADALEDWVKLIKCPVLVVRGQFDPLAPQRWVEQVANLLPEGKWAVIPKAAHAINYSAPDELARLIQGLIEETGDFC
jgi:2-hydroxy-6-oxonona-2,4-dienedioate hydrolase